jgi:hypothetical protein
MPRVKDIRLSIFKWRQKVLGKSDGPTEVLNSLATCVVLKRVQKISQVPSASPIWIPDEEDNFLKFFESENFRNRRVVIGPNIRVQESVVAETIRTILDYQIVVPSKSMKDILMNMQPKYNHERIHVWPAGIDTNSWKPTGVRSEKCVVIYSKGPNYEFATKNIIENLVSKGFQILQFHYGEYKQNDFKDALNRAKFAVWIGHTETQGIAQFQAWSMNVPTLVLCLDEETRMGTRGDLVSPAPYLTNETGAISIKRIVEDSELVEFISKLAGYSPRNWITHNASNSISTDQFLKILYNDAT